jgi:hypothetical protein
LTEIIRFLDEVGNVIHEDILKSKLVAEGALSASDFIEVRCFDFPFSFTELFVRLGWRSSSF